MINNISSAVTALASRQNTKYGKERRGEETATIGSEFHDLCEKQIERIDTWAISIILWLYGGLLAIALTVIFGIYA